MAEENLKAQVVLTVDDSGATKSIDNLTGAINEAGASAQGWAQQVGDLKKQLASVDPSSREWTELALQYKELGGSSKVVSQSVDELKGRLNDLGANVPTEPVKNFRQQIKDLTNELQTTNLPKTSAEYQNLKTRLEQLKDAQKDFNEEIGANAGPAFESAGNNLRNLQSRLGSLDFAGAADSINGLAKNVKGLNFSGATEGSGAFTKSVLNLGKALLTNPIFLIGGIIALIVTNFDKLANVIPGVGIAFEAIGKVVGFVKDAITGFTDAIGITAVAAADAVDSAIANLEGNQKKLDNARRLAVANAQKTGGDVKAVNDEYRNKEIAENQNLINQVNALEKKGVLLTKEQVDARSKALSANGEINIKAAEDEAAGVSKAREDAEKAEADRIEKAKQAAQQRAQQIKQNEAEVTQAIKDAREARFQAGLSDEEKELRQLDLKYEKLKTQAGNNQTLINQIAAEKEAERLGVLKKYSDLELAQQAEKDKALADQVRQNAINEAAELEALEEANFQAGLTAKDRELQALRDSYFERIEILKAAGLDASNLENELLTKEGEIRQKYRDEETKKQEDAAKAEADKAKQLSDARIQAASNTVTTLLSLNEAFAGKSQQSQKAAFQRQKALQIAQTGIETYKAAQGAYASQLIPGDPTSVPRAFIAAAAAVAAGLANVAKIKATTFSSPAPSGGNNTSVPSLSAQGVAASGGTVPDFNPLAAFNIQNQPQQAQPAYVLAGDVASSLEARAKVQDLARL